MLPESASPKRSFSEETPLFAADAMPGYEERRQIIETLPLSRQCQEYMERAKAIMDDDSFWLEQASRPKPQEASNLIENPWPHNRATIICECKTVISWYLHFIKGKFCHAFSGKMNSSREDHPIQNYSNGSAKVALVAVERSLVAWAHLLQLMPDESRMPPILSLLTAIDRSGREAFPDAMKFVRPGFDD